jgi:hypothetical protein
MTTSIFHMCARRQKQSSYDQMQWHQSWHQAKLIPCSMSNMVTLAIKAHMGTCDLIGDLHQCSSTCYFESSTQATDV